MNHLIPHGRRVLWLHSAISILLLTHRVTTLAADPLRAGMPVGAVAGRWGFLDAAHFSRSFRDAFGVSPSDWRRGAPA